MRRTITWILALALSRDFQLTLTLFACEMSSALGYKSPLDFAPPRTLNPIHKKPSTRFQGKITEAIVLKNISDDLSGACLFFFMRVSTALRAANSHNFSISIRGALHKSKMKFLDPGLGHFQHQETRSSPMKKHLLQRIALIVLGASVLCGMPRLLAGDAQQSLQQAELLRTLSGTKLGPSGFSTAKQVKLEKGMIYDVWGMKDDSTVVLLVDGDLVLVRKSDLRISKKVVKEPGPGGFIPGRIVFRSAYYGPPDERPRNDPQVLRILRSMVSRDEIRKPVELLVTDVFLGRDAKDDKVKGYIIGQVDSYGNVSGDVRISKPKKNVLIVEYQFNGEFHKKSAVEESILVLP